MLVAFDFDGTLSDSEMTVLLGSQNGTAEDMADITERAMNNEIEYAESLRQRCALLEGLSEEKAQDAFDESPCAPARQRSSKLCGTPASTSLSSPAGSSAASRLHSKRRGSKSTLSSPIGWL